MSLSQSKRPNSIVDSDSGHRNGRSHIAIFIGCVHLLNLDTLDDWPSISEDTFSTKTSNQSIQQRLKGVEWSLYRLFEIYNPQQTQNVGRPNNQSTVY